MSRITIRNYSTTGAAQMTADIVWDPSDPVVTRVDVSQDIPGGGIGSVSVIPSASSGGYITVPIFPDDVPEPDVFSLPLNLTDPLPAQLVGAQLPSVHFPTPFTISALSDTEFGFRVSTGS